MAPYTSFDLGSPVCHIRYEQVQKALPKFVQLAKGNRYEDDQIMYHQDPIDGRSPVVCGRVLH
jgi:hypothetical protein